jgi:Response regulator containing a CheY-like receiver domain and an HTH DNA-binding domain
MDKITIVIADSHQLIRQAWSFFLNQDPRFNIIGEAAGAEMLSEMIVNRKPDIVLMDIEMNGVAHPQFRSWMNTIRHSRFIAVSSAINPLYARELLEEGIHGYITKYSSSADLTQSIIEVFKGNQYICTQVKKRLIQNGSFYREKEEKMSLLTKKEMDIVALVKSGYSSKEIAGKLFLSIKTVEVHRHNILRKLNLRNSASLVNYIARL